MVYFLLFRITIFSAHCSKKSYPEPASPMRCIIFDASVTRTPPKNGHASFKERLRVDTRCRSDNDNITRISGESQDRFEGMIHKRNTGYDKDSTCRNNFLQTGFGFNFHTVAFANGPGIFSITKSFLVISWILFINGGNAPTITTVSSPVI